MGEQNFSLKWSGSDIPAIAMTVTDIVHGLGIAVHVKQNTVDHAALMSYL